MNWQVTYKNEDKTIIKYYANMNSASNAVTRLAINGIEANFSPVWQGGNTI